MRRRVTQRLAAAVLTGTFALGSSGCFNTAVTAKDKMARACGDYAKAVEADSRTVYRQQVSEAQRWTKHAAKQDTSLKALKLAFDKILLDVQHPNRKNRDVTEVESAIERAVNGCDTFADAATRNRIHVATSSKTFT
jgi:hypothetical protein